MITTNCCTCRSFNNDSSIIPSGPFPVSFLDKSVNFTGDATGGLGTGQYASINPGTASLDPTADFSIHAWIKPDNDATLFARVIQSTEQGVGGRVTGYSLGLGGNTNLHSATSNSFRLSFSVDDGVAEVVRFTAEPVIVPNIWTHVIAVWDDTAKTITIYVNGVSQILYIGPAVSYTGVTIPGVVIGWHGPIDSLYIWKGNLCDIALVHRKITDIEASSLNIRTTDLIAHSINDKLKAWWKLGTDDTFPILKDSKGPNNLTMNVNMSGANIVTVIPFPNNPSPHTNTHSLLNTDPLKIQAGGIGYPILYDHFMIQTTASLGLGMAGWGVEYSSHAKQIRWYGSEAGHPGVVTLDNYAIESATEFASILYGGDGVSINPIWNYVIDQPHLLTNPNPGPLTMEWLVKFSRITTTQLERGAFGWGDRFTTAAPLVHPVHNNGFYIEYDPSIDTHFRLIATRTTGGVSTTVIIGTTVIVVDTWYKISAVLRYEILTAGATTYSPKISLLVNDVEEKSTTAVVSLPDNTANLGFGARYDTGTAPIGIQDVANNYKTPTVPYIAIDWVIVYQITAGPGLSTTTPTVFNQFSVNFPGGDSDRVTLPNAIASGLSTNTALSVSIWAKRATTGAGSFTLFHLTRADVNVTKVLVDFSADVIRVGARSTAEASLQIRGSTSTFVSTTSWYHIVGVIDIGGDNIDIYVDGALVADDAAVIAFSGASFNADAGTNQSIGDDANAAHGREFEGRIDEVSMWDKILTLSEVQEIYNSGEPKDLSVHSAIANLTHHWRMGDALSGSTIPDQVGSDDATLAGATAIVSDVAP